jgi:hypothetical protein
MEWLKRRFGAFAHTFRPPKPWAQKWCFERLMYFWCISRILPDHQNQVLFLTSGLAKNVFVAFSHTFRPPETWTQKWCYLTSEVAIYVFWRICTYFQTTRVKFLKKIFFNVWSGLKRVLLHLRILPDHQNQVFKKIFFVMYEVVKNVLWCICAYFQTTRNIGSKMMLFYVWSGNIHVLMLILRNHHIQVLKKDIF